MRSEILPPESMTPEPVTAGSPPAAPEAKPEPGPEVKPEEVIRFASPRCRACWASGTIAMCPVSGARHKTVCGCAVQRFRAKHAQDVETVGDRLHWKAGRANG